MRRPSKPDVRLVVYLAVLAGLAAALVWGIAASGC